jgi:MoaA/NifB/PqqE/SkfB family radical SAM enzyme
MIVVWRVTERCNLACGFCAYDRRLPGARRDADGSAAERFGRLLGTYQAETGEPVLLSWLGGEPFLWKPLLDLSSRLRREVGIDISATTNGTQLHRTDVRERVLHDFSELTVSVDGLSDFHDHVRGRLGGWERIRDGIIWLVEARRVTGIGPKLRVNVVLMHDNLRWFANLCEELAGWGIDEITFNQLGGRDRPEFFPAHRLRMDDILWLKEELPLLSARLATRGVILCASPRYLGRLEASAAGRALPVADCHPGEAFLFVDEQHRVAPCSFTAMPYGVPMAEVTTVDELIALPERFAAKRAGRLESACSDCPSTRVFAKFEA